jgi:hypothetical protein
MPSPTEVETLRAENIYLKVENCRLRVERLKAELQAELAQLQDLQREALAYQTELQERYPSP